MACINFIIELLFSSGMCINAVLFVMQAVKLYRAKSSAGISLSTFLGFLLIQFTIILHGINQEDYGIVFGYIPSIVSCSIVVALIFIYRRNIL